MMEQMCMVEETVTDERKAFDLIYPELKNIIMDAPLESGILRFKELDNCGSVYFLDQGELFIRIRIRKKARYILIPEQYEDILPERTQVSRTKSDAGMVRISIQAPEDILKYADVLRQILARISRKSRDFGCCSRYEECSNTKACVHPDPAFAVRCWYRSNLIDGKIFYGDNKNI